MIEVADGFGGGADLDSVLPARFVLVSRWDGMGRRTVRGKHYIATVCLCCMEPQSWCRGPRAHDGMGKDVSNLA